MSTTKKNSTITSEWIDTKKEMIEGLKSSRPLLFILGASVVAYGVSDVTSKSNPLGWISIVSGSLFFLFAALWPVFERIRLAPFLSLDELNSTSRFEVTLVPNLYKKWTVVAVAFNKKQRQRDLDKLKAWLEDNPKVVGIYFGHVDDYHLHEMVPVADALQQLEADLSTDELDDGPIYDATAESAGGDVTSEWNDPSKANEEATASQLISLRNSADFLSQYKSLFLYGAMALMVAGIPFVYSGQKAITNSIIVVSLILASIDFIGPKFVDYLIGRANSVKQLNFNTRFSVHVNAWKIKVDHSGITDAVDRRAMVAYLDTIKWPLLGVYEALDQPSKLVTRKTLLEQITSYGIESDIGSMHQDDATPQEIEDRSEPRQEPPEQDGVQGPTSNMWGTNLGHVGPQTMPQLVKRPSPQRVLSDVSGRSVPNNGQRLRI